MSMLSCSWDTWTDKALAKLHSLQNFKIITPLTFSIDHEQLFGRDLETFQDLQPWDRASVEVELEESAYQQIWLYSVPGDKYHDLALYGPGSLRKLILFSGNDYLGLCCHPAVKRAAAKTSKQHGMGSRGSAMICGYTNYHMLLESYLADLLKKEECLLCSTGFAANTSLMAAIGNVSSLLAAGKKPLNHEKVAIFSDALNHASIIDGIHFAERQKQVEGIVYRHCDTLHLDALLSSCTMEKKVVISDALFSMDGDYAPILELVKLRKKHGFLLVLDDAHGTLIFGKNGGGVGEEFNCELDIDIIVGSLSKAIGSNGGFITCSKKWKHLIQSTGRSFIFTTAIPLPNVAAAYAALMVAKKEKWRKNALWSRVQDFRDLTNIPITSPIISIVIGSIKKSISAGRKLLESGFHVIVIPPPVVPPNSCRLRITLSAAHTKDDLKKMTSVLSEFINFPGMTPANLENPAAKL